MNLKDLAAAVPSALTPELFGDPETVVEALSYDSRQVFPGVCFVCLKGEKSDGHEFRDAALRSGAIAFVVDKSRAQDFGSLHKPLIAVSDTRSALPYIAAAFYGYPTRSFELIGITGTNGKTTTAFMVAAIWEIAGTKTGVIGTVGAYVGGKSFPSKWTVSTTPESLDLQQFFAQMRREGVQHAAVEVTSIAIDQRRTDACDFDTAIYTNLTQDHLDYHVTMEAYEEAKARLFLDYPSSGAKDFLAVINGDDLAGARLALRTTAAGYRTVTYGVIRTDVDFAASEISAQADGTAFRVTESSGENYMVQLPVGGLFNVSNSLAAIAATRSRGLPIETVQRGLAALPPVPGRFEPVPAPSKKFDVIVDYAHTSDGLENVLKSGLALKPGRLGVVFGCGGNRDRGKRPKMGKIAVDLADYVIVTSDNPRNEDPEFIIGEILDGIVDGKANSKVKVFVDRREAINYAICEAAMPGDLVIIAGKGHETYQLIKGDTFPFDDREVAAEALSSCS